MITVNHNVILMLALTVLLSACVPPIKKAEILPQYTEVQLCHSSRNANDLNSELLSHAVIRNKQLFPDSEITVFLIEDIHSSAFEASDTVSDSIRRIQSNIYYTLTELDRLYCLEFLGHESISSPIMDIRDNADFNSFRTQLLNQYGNMKESDLVELLISKGLGGAEIYSLLHLNHHAFIVDNYNPREITIASELLTLEKQLSTYVRQKYKQPEKVVIDSTIAEHKSNAAALECDLYELFLQRGFDAGRNIIDLAKELRVTKLAILYGAAHTRQFQSVFSDSHVSHFVLRPNDVGFIPTLDQLFSHCTQSQAK